MNFELSREMLGFTRVHPNLRGLQPETAQGGASRIGVFICHRHLPWLMTTKCLTAREVREARVTGRARHPGRCSRVCRHRVPDSHGSVDCESRRSAARESGDWQIAPPPGRGSRPRRSVPGCAGWHRRSGHRSGIRPSPGRRCRPRPCRRIRSCRPDRSAIPSGCWWFQTRTASRSMCGLSSGRRAFSVTRSTGLPSKSSR